MSSPWTNTSARALFGNVYAYVHEEADGRWFWYCASDAIGVIERGFASSEAGARRAAKKRALRDQPELRKEKP